MDHFPARPKYPCGPPGPHGPHAQIATLSRRGSGRRHQEWLLARDKIVSRLNETNAAWNVECARAAAELMNVEKQLAAAEAKAVQLERELTEANAQVLEAKCSQLAALRAGKASEAAHKMTLQSKQWDRGKMRVQQ